MKNIWGNIKENGEPVIDKNIPIPLYYQLINLIQENINSGALKPGDALPTEREFRTIYGLSQTTIRKAISELVHNNIVEARRPKGVFVCRPKIEEYSNGILTSFTEEFLERGYQPHSKILRFETVPIYGHVAEELKMASGGLAHYIYRLRYLNGDPVSLNYDWISSALVPNLRYEDFTETGKEQSLYYNLHQLHGVKLVHAVETVMAVSLSKEEAALLNAAVGSPVVSRKRLAFDELSRPVLSEKTLIRYVYKTTLVGK